MVEGPNRAEVESCAEGFTVLKHLLQKTCPRVLPYTLKNEIAAPGLNTLIKGENIRN